MRTLSDLRQGLRDWIQEPNSTAPFTDAFLTRQLNRSLRKLALKVSQKYPSFYFDTETITTTDGKYMYDLPDDYWRTHGIKNSDGVYLRVARPDEVDSGTSNEASDATHFTRMGNQIQLEPPPGTTGKTYTHEYFRVPTEMEDDDDEPDFPPGYEDIIELDAAIMCGITDGAMLNDVHMQYQERLSDMMMTLDEWQTRQPPHVTFVKRDFGNSYPNTNTRR
jgi:hypothetical protein